MMSKNHSQKELDRLFNQLKSARDENSIQEVEAKIWDIWMASDDPQSSALLEKGCKVTAQGKYTEAIEAFSRIIDRNPKYAEAWNKRATAFYLRGDYKASLEDIRQTLSLEKRHFGALYGLASIYLAIGYFKGALKAFEQLAKIFPHRKDIKENIKSLKKKVS